MAFSFTTAGATPTTPSVTSSPFSLSTTPQAKALNNASPNINWNALTLSPANSTTAKAKSQTIQHPDGTKVTTTYHPDTPTVVPKTTSTPAPAPAPKPDTTGITSGLLNVQSGLNTLQQEQQQNSFPGMLSSLRTASQPNTTQTGLIQNVSQTAAGNAPIADEAKRISDEYAKRIAQTGALGAGAVAGDLSTGTDVVGSGNAAIASQSASARAQALAQAQEAALQGTGQQLTAQNQAANAYGTALGGANTQQAQQISGLGTAAGLTQPSGNYPFVFSPSSGTFSNAGSGGVATPQQIAQAVISGQTTYEQAKSALGYLGGTGEAQLQAAITAAGGNPLQLQSQGAAQQSNISQQNTAQTDIARQGLEKATNDYVAMTGAAQFAQQQSSAVSNILSSAGLNNSTSVDYNKAINTLSSRFSSQNYAALNAALQEARAAYANLLSTGGQTPTGNETQALSTLDINQSAASINASIQQLDNAIARRLQAQNQIKSQFQQNLGGGQTSGTITWDSL